MIKKLKRCLLALLALTLAASTLSCGFIKWNGTEAPDAQPPETAETEPMETEADTEAPKPEITEPTNSESARKRLSELYCADLSASSVIIATVDDTTVCPINTDGDPVLASRADCRRAVEEKYNTHIISKSYTPNELLEAAKEAYNSDMYLADLMAVRMSDVGTYHAEGLLANLHSLPHSDFSAEYFNASSLEAATFVNGLYAVAGAATLNPDYLDCVYFNKDLTEVMGTGDLYELCDAGEWTWDKYTELTKAAYDTGTAGNGSTSGTAEFIGTAALSMGLSYVSNERGSMPAVDYLDGGLAERARSAVDTLAALTTKSGFSKIKGDELRADFNTGKVLFLTDKLYFTSWIPDSSTDWGILPLPKLTAEDDGYITPMPDDSPVFCALINTPGYETSGLILRAINAAAHEYTLGEYKHKCVNYYLRDSGSARMLDIICSEPKADFAHMYASGYSSLDDAAFGAIKRAVTTRTSIDTAYRQYKSAANRQLAAGY